MPLDKFFGIQSLSKALLNPVRYSLQDLLRPTYCFLLSFYRRKWHLTGQPQYIQCMDD